MDGQAVATSVLVDLLSGTFDIRRVNTKPFSDTLVGGGFRIKLSTGVRYARMRPRIRDALSNGAPVIWTSVSRQVIGHWRDKITVLPAFRPGQSVVAVAHWGNFDQLFTQRATATSAARMMRQLNRLVLLSPLLADRVAPWVPEQKQCVIPNHVPQCATPEQVAARVAPHGQLRVLFVGNMIQSKGYRDVLDAVGLAHRSGLNLTADFVGGWVRPSDEEDFARRVRALGVEDCVTHHGMVRDRSRVHALYRDADVCALPTYYPTEAQPLVIIEALSAGTPVVATRHAAIETMVRHEQEAWFVPPRDPEALAQAFQTITAARLWLKLSRNGRARYESLFGADAVRNQWIDLLRTLA